MGGRHRQGGQSCRPRRRTRGAGPQSKQTPSTPPGRLPGELEHSGESPECRPRQSEASETKGLVAHRVVRENFGLGNVLTPRHLINACEGSTSTDLEKSSTNFRREDRCFWAVEEDGGVGDLEPLQSLDGEEDSEPGRSAVSESRVREQQTSGRLCNCFRPSVSSYVIPAKFVFYSQTGSHQRRPASRPRRSRGVHPHDSPQ